MDELAGAAALITGGTTGLGFEIARRFLQEGASAVITGRNAALGAEAVDRLAPLGRRDVRPCGRRRSRTRRAGAWTRQLPCSGGWTSW